MFLNQFMFVQYSCHTLDRNQGYILFFTACIIGNYNKKM